VPNLETSFLDIGRLDRLARGDTPVHRLDPRAKLLTTLVFLVCVVSFGKYEVVALLPFLVFPVALVALGGLPLGYLLGKLLVVAPFAVLVGAANPFFDPAPLVHLGPVTLSGGWVSYASILLRFVLTVAAALVLIATTSFQGVCVGLQRLGLPEVMVVQLLLLYRYLFVLTDEGLRLVRARALRSCGRRGTGIRVFGSLVGHLLLRTLDRARRIHRAMLARGFHGRFHCSRPLRIGMAEVRFTAGWCSLFVLFRLVNVPQLLGTLLM
jgi:cobalt/nickel transport system permease protein